MHSYPASVAWRGRGHLHKDSAAFSQNQNPEMPRKDMVSPSTDREQEKSAQSSQAQARRLGGLELYSTCFPINRCLGSRSPKLQRLTASIQRSRAAWRPSRSTRPQPSQQARITWNFRFLWATSKCDFRNNGKSSELK